MADHPDIDAHGCALTGWGDCLGIDPADELHYHEVTGQSGRYVVAFDEAGAIVRDDRPWQMQTGVL